MSANIKIHCKYDDLINPESLKNHPKNRNKHGEEQVDKLAELYVTHGVRHPIIVSKLSGFIVSGHARRMAAVKAGLKEFPVVYQDFENAQKEYAFIQSDNAIALWAELDLSGIVLDLEELDLDLNLLAIKDIPDVFDHKFASKDEMYTDGVKGSLQANFIAPPFSVLDTKQDYWQKRKREWLALGIESEKGRSAGAFTTAGSLKEQKDTSIFDPVLAEVMYEWFCPKDGLILDCFAGGSVRGIVASLSGRKYVGVDLRQEQIEANKAQLHITQDPKPIWYQGDSLQIKKICEHVKADMIFSCPPYADLEIYSNDPRDISSMGYNDFKKAYFEIIRNTCDLLKEDSFACFVVGEVRDKKGNYYNFVGDTINAFNQAGLEYYNEIILVNAIGTLPLRAGKTFKSGRKVGKMHQNILVFLKGNATNATKKIGAGKVLFRTD